MRFSNINFTQIKGFENVQVELPISHALLTRDFVYQCQCLLSETITFLKVAVMFVSLWDVPVSPEFGFLTL